MMAHSLKALGKCVNEFISETKKQNMLAAAAASKLAAAGGSATSVGDDMPMEMEESSVPYHTSVMSLFCKPAMQGDTQLVFVGTISPCVSDFKESVSTLRFADR
jgi:hypothetical protein